MAEKSIQLDKVSKIYRLGGEEIHALDGVSLSIKQGDFVAITGPSGSGKSTLANVIGGLDSPTSGHVTVAGDDLAKSRDTQLSAYRNHQVGFVFQTFNLMNHLNALENVMLPLQLGGVRGTERRQRAVEALTAVGLEDRMKHKPNQLSGGQRQRVSIARALANAPSIIIADEPTGNLDSVRGAEIIDLLRGLNRKGITLLVITHDSAVARRARRILELRDGRLTEKRRASA